MVTTTTPVDDVYVNPVTFRAVPVRVRVEPVKFPPLILIVDAAPIVDAEETKTLLSPVPIPVIL